MEDPVLGDRELDVMAVLWEIRSGTVGEVRDRLDVRLAYTTVLTILRNLEAKGCVLHEEEGRAYRYFPRVKQQAAQRNALARLVDKFFDGSPEALLSRLVDDHGVSPDELRRLARTIRTSHPRKGGPK